MALPHLLSWFFGGVFLANAVPRLVNRVSGRPFQGSSQNLFQIVR